MSKSSPLTPYNLLAEAFENNRIKTDSLDEWLELFLVEAETLFGPRLFPTMQQPTKIFFEGNRPGMVFGEKDEDGKFKQFLIKLSNNARTDLQRALYELSHESVHLLSPVPWEDTMLEEGIACWYEEHWARKCPNSFPAWAQNVTHYGFQHKKYSEAKRLVTELLELDKTCIRRMREIEPQLGKITASLILQTVPNADPGAAKALVKKWFRRPNPDSIKRQKKAPSLLTLAAPIAVHAFPSSQTTSQKQLDEFRVWSRETDITGGNQSADVKFDGMPVLEVSRAAGQKERIIFKQVDVSRLRGRTISFEFCSKGRHYFARRVIKVANEHGQILFTDSGFADCFNNTWLKEAITFTVPNDGSILEISFVLHRIATLWLASPRIIETEKSASPAIQCTSTSPYNLDFKESIDSPSPSSGWQRSFMTNVLGENNWQFKNVRLDTKKTYKEKNSVELRARGCNERDVCEFFQRFTADSYKRHIVLFSGVFKVESSDVRFETFIDSSSKNLSTETLSLSKAKWQPFRMEAVVPSSCEILTVGFRLIGQGFALVSALKFEIVP
jgi:hypothetical protein